MVIIWKLLHNLKLQQWRADRSSQATQQVTHSVSLFSNPDIIQYLEARCRRSLHKQDRWNL